MAPSSAVAATPDLTASIQRNGALYQMLNSINLLLLLHTFIFLWPTGSCESSTTVLQPCSEEPLFARQR